MRPDAGHDASGGDDGRGGDRLDGVVVDAGVDAAGVVDLDEERVADAVARRGRGVVDRHVDRAVDERGELAGLRQGLRADPELDGVVRERPLVVEERVAGARGGVAVEVEGLAGARRVEVERVGRARPVVDGEFLAVGDVVVVGVEALVHLEVEEIRRAVGYGLEQIVRPPPAPGRHFGIDGVVEVDVRLGVGGVGEPVRRGVGVVQHVVLVLAVVLLLVGETVLIRVGRRVAGEPRARLVVKVRGARDVDVGVRKLERRGRAAHGPHAEIHAEEVGHRNAVADARVVGPHDPVLLRQAVAVGMLVGAVEVRVAAGLGENPGAAVDRVEAVEDFPVVVHAVAVGIGVAGLGAREAADANVVVGNEGPFETLHLRDVAAAGLPLLFPRGGDAAVGEVGRAAVLHHLEVRRERVALLLADEGRVGPVIEQVAVVAVVHERPGALIPVGAGGNRLRGILQIAHGGRVGSVPAGDGRGVHSEFVGRLAEPGGGGKLDFVRPARFETDDGPAGLLHEERRRRGTEEVGSAVLAEVDALAIGEGVLKEGAARNARHFREIDVDAIEREHDVGVGAGDRVGAERLRDERVAGAGRDEGRVVHVAVGEPERLVVRRVPLVVAPAVDGGGEVFLIVREAVAVGVAVGAELRAVVRRGLEDRVHRVEQAGLELPGVGQAVHVGVDGAGVQVDESVGRAVAVHVRGEAENLAFLVFKAVIQTVAVGVGEPGACRKALVRPVLVLHLVPRSVVVAARLNVLGEVGLALDLKRARFGRVPVLELADPVEAVAVGILAEILGAAARKARVEEPPRVIDQVDHRSDLIGVLLGRVQAVADVERPTVGDGVAAVLRGIADEGGRGVVVAGTRALDRPVGGVHDRREAGGDRSVLAEHPLERVKLLAAGERDRVPVIRRAVVEVRIDRGLAGDEPERGLAVPVDLVRLDVVERVNVAVALVGVHRVAVGVGVSVGGIVRIEAEDELPAVGHAVAVGVPVERIRAEVVLLDVEHAVVVEILGRVPGDVVVLAAEVGFENAREVRSARAGEFAVRIELVEKPLLREEAVRGAVADGERGVAGADEGLNVLGIFVIARQVEGAGAEVDVRARNFGRFVGKVLGVVAMLHVEELGAAAGVEEPGAGEHLERVAHRELDGGATDGHDIRGDVALAVIRFDFHLVGVVECGHRGVLETDEAVAPGVGSAAVVAVRTNDRRGEGLFGMADEGAVGVFDRVGVGDGGTQERDADRAEVGRAVRLEFRVRGERRIVRAPVFGLVFVEDGAPEVVLPAVGHAVAVGVVHRRVGARAVAAAVAHGPGQHTGIADADEVGRAPVRGVGLRRLLETAEFLDVGEEGLVRGLLLGAARHRLEVRVGEDAVVRREFGDVLDVRAVVHVRGAGNRVGVDADEVAGARDVVRIVRPDVLDDLLRGRRKTIVVRRVGGFAVLRRVLRRAVRAEPAGGDGDGEGVPRHAGRGILFVLQVEVLRLPGVRETVLIEVAERVERQVRGFVVEAEVRRRRNVADRRGRAGRGRGDGNRARAGVRNVEVLFSGHAVIVHEPSERIRGNVHHGAVNGDVGSRRNRADRNRPVRVELVAGVRMRVLGGVAERRRILVARVEDGRADALAVGDGAAGELVGEEDRRRVGERDLPVAEAGDGAVLVARLNGENAVGVERELGRVGGGVTDETAVHVPVVPERGVGGHVGRAGGEPCGRALKRLTRRRVVLGAGGSREDRGHVRHGDDKRHRLRVDGVAGERERDVFVAVARREPVLVVGAALGDADRGRRVHRAGRGVVRDGEVDRVGKAVPEVEVERRAVRKVGLGDDDAVHHFAGLRLAELDVGRRDDLDRDRLRERERSLDRVRDGGGARHGARDVHRAGRDAHDLAAADHVHVDGDRGARGARRVAVFIHALELHDVRRLSVVVEDADRGRAGGVAGAHRVLQVVVIARERDVVAFAGDENLRIRVDRQFAERRGRERRGEDEDGRETDGFGEETGMHRVFPFSLLVFGFGKDGRRRGRGRIRALLGRLGGLSGGDLFALLAHPALHGGDDLGVERALVRFDERLRGFHLLEETGDRFVGFEDRLKGVRLRRVFGEKPLRVLEERLRLLVFGEDRAATVFDFLAEAEDVLLRGVARGADLGHAADVLPLHWRKGIEPRTGGRKARQDRRRAFAGRRRRRRCREGLRAGGGALREGRSRAERGGGQKGAESCGFHWKGRSVARSKTWRRVAGATARGRRRRSKFRRTGSRSARTRGCRRRRKGRCRRGRTSATRRSRAATRPAAWKGWPRRGATPCRPPPECRIRR